MNEIIARVSELRRDGRFNNLGEFRFVSKPSSGDRLVIGEMSGDLDIYEVDHIEHHLARTGLVLAGDPSLTVIVRYHSSWSPDGD
ncbi:hypothetical protein ACI7BZ_12170 [Xanthobacter sp. AM11]|uniref:hypothetical protein n=1 Tax=Xanthobacter sp. AM11 TaxID=3380643 RepID=UPI0039BEEE31